MRLSTIAVSLAFANTGMERVVGASQAFTADLCEEYLSPFREFCFCTSVGGPRPSSTLSGQMIRLAIG